MGGFLGPHGTNKNNIFIKITVPHTISGEYVKYNVLIDREGMFSIDVETAISLIHFCTSLNTEKALVVKLKSGDITYIDIAYNSDSDIENINVTPGMNRCFDLVGEMLTILHF